MFLEPAVQPPTPRRKYTAWSRNCPVPGSRWRWWAYAMSSQRKQRFSYRNTAVYPRIGDRVRFLHEDDILVVEDVIDTKQKQWKWNVEEPGLMLQGGVYGRVFTKDISKDLELVKCAKERRSKGCT
jgi:hypothetical protein